jgi:hypothetical protein
VTRSGGRAVVATGVALAAALSVAVVAAVLTTQQIVRQPSVPIASLASLPQGTPVRVTSTELVGLDIKAARLRGGGWNGAQRLNTAKALPVYLVRDGDDVRGFIGVDPRNRCEIELLTTRTQQWGSFPAMLHDVCHGSIYNFAGEHIGGPSPWSLDELVVTVRDGRVYASTSAVIPGRWVAGGR